MPQFTLSAVILNVADVSMLQQCRDWYKRLGLRMTSETDGESAFFDIGHTAVLGIHTADKVGTSEATVYLEVADVESLYRDLVAQGVRFETKPERKPWGATAVALYDPAGHRLSLVTPAKD